MKFERWLLLLGAIFASRNVLAQPWTFSDLAGAAIADYPAVKAKQSAQKAAQADFDAASWARYPTPSVEVGEDRNGAKTMLLRVQQPLWTFGKITAGIDSARGRELAAQSAVRETRQDVLQKVIDAYVEALRQKAKLERARISAKLHQSLLELIERRIEHEASPRVDENLAKSRLYQAQNEVSMVNQSLSSALIRLSGLTGRKVDDVRDFELTKSGDFGDEKANMEEARGNSATLERLSFEENSAKSDASAKKAAIFPQIGLRYENSYASAAYNGLPAYSSKRLLVVVEAQTGAGLSAISGVDAANARVDSVRMERESALRDLQEKVAVLGDELQAARNRYESAIEASKSASEVYESYTRLYASGRKTWLDVLNSVRESTQQDFATIDAKAQATGAELKLQLLTGKLQEAR